MNKNASLSGLAVRTEGEWRILGAAVCAALLLSGAVPSLARAQESLELPPQYLENLQAYLASPKAGRDVSVPISPEELGLDPRGEVEAVPFAPASLPLFSAQSLSTPAQSPTYDFALQLVSINGNIPTVPDCDHLPSGALRSFFDDFDDGEVDTGCTAEFQKFGIFEEVDTSGEPDGLLHMRSEKGNRAGGSIQHNLVYKTTFKKAVGQNFFAAASFRPDIPRPLPSLFSSYSLHLFDTPPPPRIAPEPFLPNINIHILTLPSGQPVVVAGRGEESGMVFRSIPVDLSGKTSVFFLIAFDDATDTVTPFYSFDAQTLFAWGNPDGSLFTAPLFTKSDEARLMANTFVEERTPVVVVPGLFGSFPKEGIAGFLNSNPDTDWTLDPLFHTYDNLVSGLDENGYTPGVNLFALPYDWRMDNRLQVSKLKDAIARIKAVCNCPKVDIITHSMGGLIARAYIQSSDYENDINDLIFLGAPHQGAPKSYLAWEGGIIAPTGFSDGISFAFQKILSYLIPKLGYKSTFDYIQRAPITSIQQLLPVYNYLKSATSGAMLSYPVGYPENTFLDTLSGLNSPANLAKLEQSGVKITNIVGNDTLNDTINIIRVESRSAEHAAEGKWEHGYPENYDDFFGDHGLEAGSGDGTVPPQSSRNLGINNAREIIAITTHDALPTAAFSEIWRALTETDQEPIPVSSPVEVSDLLFIPIASPGDIQVIDPLGRRIGKDFATSQRVNEIPLAYYTGFENVDDIEFVTIPNPVAGEYQMQIEGTGTGGYTIEANYISNATSATSGFSANIAPSVVEGLGFSLNPSDPAATTITPTDTTSPTTRLTIRGTEGKNGWLIGEAEIALTAEDNPGGVGVFKTEYSLDNGITWQEYAGPFMVEEDGSHPVAFRSEDFVGNKEEAKFAFVRIDTTPPEARASFDPISFLLKVEGIDNLSQPIVTQNGFTYVLEDLAGNTTSIILEETKQAGKQFKAGLKSIQYGNQSPIVLDADIKAEWSLEKDGTLKELTQQLQARHFKVEAKYQGKKDETRITADTTQGRGPETREALPHLRIAQLVTENGALTYGILIAPFSAEFNGVSSILFAPSSPSLTFASDFTLEAWVKILQEPASNQSYVLVSKWEPTQNKRSYLWLYQKTASGDKQLTLCTSQAGSSFVCVAVNTGFTPLADLGVNEWHHVAARLTATSPGRPALFVDGQNLGGGITLPVPAANDSSFTIGAGRAASGTPFFPCNCRLDEVRVWNAAVTDDQIAAGRFAELTGTEQNLAGYWSFAKGFRDVSPNHNDLTSQNVVFSLDSPPLAGSLVSASASAERSMLAALLANTSSAVSWLLEAAWGFWK